MNSFETEVLEPEIQDFSVFENEFKPESVFEKPFEVRNLFFLEKELFEEQNFSTGDIMLLDNDETLIPTLRFKKYTFENLPKDSKRFLNVLKCEGIDTAIVTDALRKEHYLSGHGLPVFGYESDSQNKFLRNCECFFSWFNGTYYKKTDPAVEEVKRWVLETQNGGRSRVAIAGNSERDVNFGIRLKQKLRESGFLNDVLIYKLPSLRLFH
jgi:hypothetical protein